MIAILPLHLQRRAADARKSPSMPLSLIAMVMVMLLLAGCAEPASPAEDCTPQAQWQAALASSQAQAECVDPAAREAHLLGTELAGLRDEFAQLEQQLAAAAPEAAGALRRRQRQLQIDIEAIQAEARVRNW